MRVGRDRRISGTRISLVVAAASLVIGPFASAQTNPTLLTRPWDATPHYAQTFDDILLLPDRETKEADEDTQIFYWDSNGRIKFKQDDNVPWFWLGYKVITLDIDSYNSVLDGQYNDIALTPAFSLGEIGDGFRLAVMGGPGTANDGHFRTGDVWYGIGAIDLSKQLTPDSAIHMGVEYDGNRLLFPDSPLPFFTYAGKLRDEESGREIARYALGIPETSLYSNPVGGLIIDAKYLFPAKVDASIEYEFIGGIRLFALYSRTVEGFYLGDINQGLLNQGPQRRIFHELDRVSAGVRVMSRYIDVSIGIGYAFNHRFTDGYDLRELRTYREFEDDIFFALRLQGGFSL